MKIILYLIAAITLFTATGCFFPGGRGGGGGERHFDHDDHGEHHDHDDHH